MKLLTLDLHNTKHENVTSKVIYFIEKVLTNPEDFIIITGHSQIMRKLVIDVLDEYNLEYNIGGILEVSKAFIKVYL